MLYTAIKEPSDRSYDINQILEYINNWAIPSQSYILKTTSLSLLITILTPCTHYIHTEQNYKCVLSRRFTLFIDSKQGCMLVFKHNFWKYEEIQLHFFLKRFIYNFCIAAKFRWFPQNSIEESAAPQPLINNQPWNYKRCLNYSFAQYVILCFSFC